MQAILHFLTLLGYLYCGSIFGEAYKYAKSKEK